MPHGAHVGLGPLEVAGIAQRVDDALARLEAVEPAEVAGVLVHQAALVHHHHVRQVVALGGPEIVRVVSRGHLHRPGAELGVHGLVGDDRDLAPQEREDRALPEQLRIAPVLGMDRHGGVAEHGLGARGGHRHEPLGALDRVADEPQGAGHLLVVDLLVRERGLTARAPVDDVATAVDQALLVEALARQQHGARVGGIQREPLARPVRGDPHPAELLEDQPAELLLPLPHFLEEARFSPARRAASRPRSGSRSRRGPCRAGRAPRAPPCAASAPPGRGPIRRAGGPW